MRPITSEKSIDGTGKSCLCQRDYNVRSHVHGHFRLYNPIQACLRVLVVRSCMSIVRLSHSITPMTTSPPLTASPTPRRPYTTIVVAGLHCSITLRYRLHPPSSPYAIALGLKAETTECRQAIFQQEKSLSRIETHSRLQVRTT
jgi:hypothetical protein